MRLRWICSILLAAAAAVSSAVLQAQEEPLVRAQSRLVIEDVLVMDAHGNPVHGLPASAFHVQDQGKPQELRAFEEGSPEISDGAAVAALPPGTFSNAPSPASTTEVLLVDTDDIELLDQMFLGEQLRKSLATMPDGLPVAIFTVRNGRVIPVISATTDRDALVRSVASILPVQNHAIDSKFQSAVNQLMSVAALLQQTPGRKNLIWFAGEFPLVTVSGDQEAGSFQVNYSARANEIHQVQEALAEARVSVYPVDVRGVIADEVSIAELNKAAIQLGAAGGGTGGTGGRSPRDANQAWKKIEVPTVGPTTVAGQRAEMRELALATGGQAYMLNNLAEEIDQAFDLGKSAYTLAYVPTPYSTDQSFHHVTIEVDGGYTLSYRKGYLATFTGAPEEGTPRARLTRDGAKTIDPAQNRALIFQVKLTERGDAQHVTMSFSIPLAELKQEHSGGVWSSKLQVSTYAYDVAGKVRDGRQQELDTNLSDEQYQRARDGQKRVATVQQLTVPKGAKYLLVVARDQDSQRTGSLLLQTRALDTLPLESPVNGAMR
ncbi:VWA domain-containing protein [Terriglobus aquaticus]|uniref:VWA domain-containing protein n=1 Tax=Terriglobus aquaticus TaxID=940139 RepID=A0ABW9KHK4_9BACT|nr:VWA domain-containing protein [Terriglobus aquaticus]